MRKLLLAPFYRAGRGGSLILLTCQGPRARKAMRQVSNPGLVDSKNPYSCYSCACWREFFWVSDLKKGRAVCQILLRDPEEKCAPGSVDSTP